MTAPDSPVMNVDEVPLIDFGNGGGFAARLGRIGPLIGARELGCLLTVVAPGKRAFPFHNHHANEEMFVVLAGAGEVRIGARRFPLRAGDVVCTPAGAQDTAHQIINTGSEELSYLGLSTMKQPEITEYPDSAKFAVRAGMTGGDPRSASFTYTGRGEAPAGYWDGED